MLPDFGCPDFWCPGLTWIGLTSLSQTDRAPRVGRPAGGPGAAAIRASAHQSMTPLPPVGRSSPIRLHADDLAAVTGAE
jgi:hypothetical protein